MKKKLLVIAVFIVALIDYSFAQGKVASPITGRWINTQYEYFKNYPQSEEILFHISPWSIYIDSSGKCTVESLYEQKAEIGYPISKRDWGKEWEYYYKNVWLYTIKDNDSLLVYRTTNMPPGAGIIFKRYAGDINKQ